MSSRYVPFSHEAFTAEMTAMQFAAVAVPNCQEYVFQHIIKAPRRGVPEGRFAIRIYSSVDQRTGHTRETGSDAIRVCLIDLQHDRGERAFTRVHRTVNAMANMRKRAREAWNYVVSGERRCECGSLMVEKSGRNGPFLGCLAYRMDDRTSCKRTRPLVCNAEKKVA